MKPEELANFDVFMRNPDLFGSGISIEEILDMLAECRTLLQSN